MDKVIDEAAWPLLERIAAAMRDTGRTIAVAESMTAGRIASHLAAGEGASTWFAGGVVAYVKEVKFDLLGVEPGPVVTAACAQEMAAGVARLLGADLAVAVTGVGGPDPEEGWPAGTVFLGTFDGQEVRCVQRHWDGSPPDVVRACTRHALELLVDMLEG